MAKTAQTLMHLALIGFTATVYSYSADQTPWLESRVCRFIFHGGKPDESTHNPGVGPLGITAAAGALGQHAEVPICVERLPAISFESDETIAPIEIDASDTTVKDILDEMVRQDPRYEYRERLGVIEVLPYRADHDPDDCLNMVIPSFKRRRTWNTLISELRIHVAQVAKSAKDGAVRGGSGVLGAPAGLIEVNFEKETLRDILSLLCAKVGNMAWSAGFEGASPACQSVSFGTYKPKASYPLNTVPFSYSEGLPKECVTCHYHEPCKDKGSSPSVE